MRATRAAAKPAPVAAPGAPLADPVGALVEWSRTLRVPPGHYQSEGQPMELPEYAVAFLRRAWGKREAGLFVGRKNAKSAVIAVLLLAHLAEGGPLRRDGWRGCVVSVTRELAALLKEQMQEIAKASDLQGLNFRRSPAPGMVEGPSGSLSILAAESYSGHARGLDLAVVDETGLLDESYRPLLAGLRSSLSARDGQLMHISIRGGSPLVAELIEQDDPEVHVEVYSAPEGCALDDESAWRAANPTLGTVKSLGAMRFQARWAASHPADAAHFRAHDLNQETSPSQSLVLSVEEWMLCEQNEGEPDGPYVLGVDLGGSASMSAAAGYWPDSGALRALGAFPTIPDLDKRASADGVSEHYAKMLEAGELVLLGERTCDVAEFLRRCIAAWGAPCMVVADRYRESEALDTLAAAGIETAWMPRGQGWRDGGEDLRDFAAAVADGEVAAPESHLLRHAWSGAVTISDIAGNRKLARGSEGGRRRRAS